MTPTESPCSLTAPALEERAAVWHSLDEALVGRERTDTGAVLRYRLDANVASTLLELIEAERHCCGSVSFDATLTVRVHAAEPVRAWVADTFVPISTE